MQPARRLANKSFICQGCLSRQLQRSQRQQHRQFSRSAPRRQQQQSHDNALPAAPAPTGLAALSSRRLISVTGPDAAKYLQGVITASMLAGASHPPGRGLQLQPEEEQHPREEGFYAAFLTAQGRVLHDVFIHPDRTGLLEFSSACNKSPVAPDERFIIEVDAAEAEHLQRHIKRYKLRAKLDVRLLDPEEFKVYHAWDDLSSSVGDLAHVLGRSTEAIALQDTRAPGLGYRFITHGKYNLPSEVSEHEIPVVSEDLYTIRRYLHGVPEGQQEIIRDQALPHESNLDQMGAIDFHKGCYVGQELTIRTQHRGVVRKRILPCVLYEDHQAMPQQLTYRPTIADPDTNADAGSLTADMLPADTSIGRVGKKGRSAGKWLRGVGNIGLALCRLEIMTDVVLPGETASATYSAEDEFIVGRHASEQKDDGSGSGEQGALPPIKIKAFVPPWLRQGLNAQAQ
ncbi:putative transferase CAF17, mitochondrial [Diplogelasinospora grovesii]|uniref:Iron-sulfur cluster assembly factor IBA57 homolog, mitochondrial n=1 Tax=Diplogelasinospora grovesii TaxID=303347 RepID=A0AAN6S6M5_9PEZI|nr:putative transferase CAF17, mitochondrial [Diplogelasinospora grovesii]